MIDEYSISQNIHICGQDIKCVNEDQYSTNILPNSNNDDGF
jgi:hypothetical protein